MADELIEISINLAEELAEAVFEEVAAPVLSRCAACFCTLCRKLHLCCCVPSVDLEEDLR